MARKQQPSYYDTLLAINEKTNELRQEWEDKKVEMAARREALDLYEQWVSGHMVLIARPQLTFLMVYTKARYDSESYQALVKAEFEKLKSNHRQILA